MYFTMPHLVVRSNGTIVYVRRFAAKIVILRLLKVIMETTRIKLLPMIPISDLHKSSNHKPISYSFRNKWRLVSIIANLTPLHRGQWVTARLKNYMMGLPGREKNFTISSYRFGTMYECDRQTDRRTPHTGQQRRAIKCDN